MAPPEGVSNAMANAIAIQSRIFDVEEETDLTVLDTFYLAMLAQTDADWE